LETQIKKLIETIPSTLESMDKMVKTELDREQILEFAKNALKTRLPEEKIQNVDFDSFIEPVRGSDKGNNLWLVFNRIQEKIISGDFEYGVTKHGKKRKGRAIKNFNQDLEVNQDLFNLALEYVEVLN